MKVSKITDIEFVKYHIDFERYVLIYSSDFEAIFDEKMKDTNNSNMLEGLVKITNNNNKNKKSVYRKCIGRHVEKDIVQMGYRTQSELEIKSGNEVEIKPAKWFPYYWHNSDSYYKYPFRIACIALIITCLSFLLNILFLLW